MTAPPPFSHFRVRERIAIHGLAAAPHKGSEMQNQGSEHTTATPSPNHSS